MRTAAAQHLYFLREAGVSRKDVAALLDGFREVAADEEAPYLLLTVSTVLALMGAPSDATGGSQEARAAAVESGPAVDPGCDGRGG